MRTRAKRNEIYDDDILFCPVARDFPWRDSDDSPPSPFAPDYISLCPRLTVEDALEIAERVSFSR